MGEENELEKNDSRRNEKRGTKAEQDKFTKAVESKVVKKDDKLLRKTNVRREG